MNEALGELLAAVADQPRWGQALQRYAASFRADLLGGAFLAESLEQLGEWGAEFAQHPEVEHWLAQPSQQGAPALLAMGVTPEAATQYAQHYRLCDPLWHQAEALRVQAQRQGHACWVAADASVQHTQAFQRSAIYNDFLRTHGIGSRLFGGGVQADHPVGRLFMSMYRQGDDTEFGAQDIERFGTEFAVVQRAAYLHREMVSLRARTQGLERLMEQMPLGLMFLDAGGRLLHANARARMLWADPLLAGVRVPAGGSVLNGGGPALLKALFLQALQGHSGSVALSAQVMLVVLAVGELAPLGLAHAADGVACVLLERELDSRRAVELMRQAYRLSATETQLLQALMDGQTPQEFADARGVRISTVRTQMSTLLAKTGTARQQELVAQVARLMLLPQSG